MEGTIILKYINEILEVWEAYHADIGMTEPWELEPGEGLMAGDIVPKEFYDYLYVFEAKDNRGLLPY
jgi:hypothetical protein